MSDAVFEIIDERFDDYRADLFELLRQPSVSSTGEGMADCGDLLGELLERYGFDSWKRIETSRYPLVYAERVVDESRPTVVFYGHYDVQPPGDEALWESPPFEPTVRDGSIYARGSGDNKGQLVTHVFAADALTAVADELPVNVKLLFEGGEENGSEGLIEYLEDDPAEIRDADLVYVADGPMHRSRRPTLIYGNRGLLAVQLDHECAADDLHSGNFGGPVPNAANELVELLSTMFEGDEVTIDGFRDGIEVTDAQRELVESIPADDEALMAELGLDRLATERPYYERLLLEPTLTVNGLSGGYDGEGIKTIIPHRATAKLDMRLVPGQDPHAVYDAVAAHVRERNPDVEVTKMGTFPPMSTPVDTPAADVVRAALRETWDAEPVEMPLLGGSLPAAYFRDSIDAPVLVIPYANPDQGNHSPNEHLDLDCLRNGIKTSAGVIERLGAAAEADSETETEEGVA